MWAILLVEPGTGRDEALTLATMMDGSRNNLVGRVQGASSRVRGGRGSGIRGGQGLTVQGGGGSRGHVN